MTAPALPSRPLWAGLGPGAVGSHSTLLAALPGCADFSARCPSLPASLRVTGLYPLPGVSSDPRRPSCDPASPTGCCPFPPQSGHRRPCWALPPHPAMACEGPLLWSESPGPGCWPGLVQLSPTPIHHTASPPPTRSGQGDADSRQPGCPLPVGRLRVLYRAPAVPLHPF